MKRTLLLFLLLPLMGAARASADGIPADSTGAVTADTTLTFLVEVGSRLYPDWKEDRTVRLREPFFLGDTDLTARLVSFMPDFRIIDKKPRNVSPRMGNPAAFVMVAADTGAVDSSWAFLNFPPHFSATSFFTFRLKEVKGYVEPERKEN